MSGPTFGRRQALALVGAAGCWGVGTVVSKQAIAEVPAVSLLVVQLAASVVLLLAMARIRSERLAFGRETRSLAALGILNPGLAYGLGLLGLAQISASLAVLLWAGEPILILVLAVIFLGERMSLLVVALSAVALGGLGLVLYDPGATAAIGGIVLTIAGIGCCAIYTIATRRWLRASDGTLSVVVGQQVSALSFAVVVALAAALTGSRLVPVGLSPLGAASAVVSGVLYYGLAYWLYVSALRGLPASTAAVSFYLIPIFGVAAAAAVGERLTAGQSIGAVAVVVAVAAIGLRTASRPPPSRLSPRRPTIARALNRAGSRSRAR